MERESLLFLCCTEKQLSENPVVQDKEAMKKIIFFALHFHSDRYSVFAWTRFVPVNESKRLYVEGQTVNNSFFGEAR